LLAGSKSAPQKLEHIARLQEFAATPSVLDAFTVTPQACGTLVLLAQLHTLLRAIEPPVQAPADAQAGVPTRWTLLRLARIVATTLLAGGIVVSRTSIPVWRYRRKCPAAAGQSCCDDRLM
jgi:hypothetical protein